MQIRHAAARRPGVVFVDDGAAQRRLTGAYDLRNGALQVGPVDAIRAPQRAEQLVPLTRGMS